MCKGTNKNLSVARSFTSLVKSDWRLVIPSSGQPGTFDPSVSTFQVWAVLGAQVDSPTQLTPAQDELCVWGVWACVCACV